MQLNTVRFEDVDITAGYISSISLSSPETINKMYSVILLVGVHSLIVHSMEKQECFPLKNFDEDYCIKAPQPGM
jgi:hypothetical protein